MGTTGFPAWLGLGLTYDREEFSFSVPSGLSVPAPWGTIHRIGFSPSITPLHLPRLADSGLPFDRLCRGGGGGPGRCAGLRRGPLGYEDHRAGPVPRSWGGGVSTDRAVARLPVPLRPVADQRPVEVVQPAPRRTCGTRGAGAGVLHRRELGGVRRGCIPFVPVPAGRGRHRPRRHRRAPGNPSLRPPLTDVAARVEGGLVRGGPPGGKARHRKRTGGPGRLDFLRPGASGGTVRHAEVLNKISEAPPTDLTGPARRSSAPGGSVLPGRAPGRPLWTVRPRPPSPS